MEIRSILFCLISFYWLQKQGNKSNENVRGVVVASTAPPVNHLLFADDCLLMFKANVMKDTIQKYCEALGQRVNLSKSSFFFGKGCPNDQWSAIKLF